MRRISPRTSARAGTARCRASTLAVLGTLAVTVLAAGCATAPAAVLGMPAPTSAPEPTSSLAPDSGTPGAVLSGDPSCSIDGAAARPVLESYRPPSPMPAPGHMPPGSEMAAIYARHSLVVGVDQDEYDWAYPNPNPDAKPGETYLGFDIDLLHALADAIFGNPDAIKFVPVAQDFRMGAAHQGIVDVVADSITITCPRAQQVAFSVDYFDAHERLLVPRDNTTISVTLTRNVPDIHGVAGGKICSIGTTTSVANLTRLAKADGFRVVLADNWSDCLALLQEGAVQAFSTDDSILDGVAAEDHYLKIGLGSFSNEPHGLAFPLGDAGDGGLVAFANGVLLGLESHRPRYCPEQPIASDASCWAALYRTWIEEPQQGTGTLKQPPAPPVPTFISG